MLTFDISIIELVILFKLIVDKKVAIKHHEFENSMILIAGTIN